MKKCKYCGTEDVENFSDTEKSRCRSCRRIESRTWRYDISWEASEAIEDITHCDICETKLNGQGKHTEHDHATGKIRGVVCPVCNSFLARIDKNNKTQQNLWDYLHRE